MIFSPEKIDLSLIKLNDKEHLIYDGQRIKWTQVMLVEEISGQCSWFGRVMEIVRWELKTVHKC